MSGLRFRLFVLMLIGTGLLATLGAQAQAAERTFAAVKGKVVWGSNDPVPVGGAKVILYGDTSISSGFSDSDGNVSFSNLRPGTYELWAECWGLVAEQAITIKRGETAAVELRLDHPNASNSRR